MGTFAPPTQTGTRYRVYITPLTAQYTYGTEVEVTDHITFNGLNQIKRAIDSQDYAIGVYFYSDLELIGSNDNGYFNDQSDIRSIFKYTRDRAKVRVVFENSSGDTIVYYGLISEEATRVDALNETITFRALSRDSIIRNTQVPGGTVANNVTVKTAFLALLNQAAISSVLTVSSANINPSNNFTIDLGSAFDEQPTQDVINNLLLASNSVMTLDSSGNVTVKSRAGNNVSALNLYGPFDTLGRQNVINISNYNTGLQRTFTSVVVTDSAGVDHVADNVALASTYGYRQASFTFDFISNAGTAAAIAASLLAEFTAPKFEMEVEVPTSIAKTLDLLDLVSVDWPYRMTPYSAGQMMPVIGVTKIGAATQPLPSKQGSLFIPLQMAFKVLEINQDPNTFTSILKIRQVGTSLSDGWFTVPSSSILGYAVIGSSTIGGTGNTASKWNPSVIGAALVGSTSI